MCFVANKGDKTYYVQVALTIDNQEKRTKNTNLLGTYLILLKK